MHDATRRALAHRLEPYSPKLVDEGPRGSILLIPSTLSPYIRGVAEALRSHPRGSQKVLERYSPSILKLVRILRSPTSTSSVPPHVLVVGGAGKYSLGTSSHNVWKAVVL
jgi:hypothetical protein